MIVAGWNENELWHFWRKVFLEEGGGRRVRFQLDDQRGIKWSLLVALFHHHLKTWFFFLVIPPLKRCNLSKSWMLVRLVQALFQWTLSFTHTKSSYTLFEWNARNSASITQNGNNICWVLFEWDQTSICHYANNTCEQDFVHDGELTLLCLSNDPLFFLPHPANRSLAPQRRRNFLWNIVGEPKD